MTPNLSTIVERCSEDPHREQHEKETAIQLAGDEERIEVTSFKAVVYEKLLQRPEYRLKHLSVNGGNARERTITEVDELRDNPDLDVIGVTGTLPVGALSIGSPRESNSHARIVKV